MQSDKTRPSAPLKKLEKDVVRAAMLWYKDIKTLSMNDVVNTGNAPVSVLYRACRRLAKRKPK